MEFSQSSPSLRNCLLTPGAAIMLVLNLGLTGVGWWAGNVMVDNMSEQLMTTNIREHVSIMMGRTSGRRRRRPDCLVRRCFAGRGQPRRQHRLRPTEASDPAVRGAARQVGKRPEIAAGTWQANLLVFLFEDAVLGRISAAVPSFQTSNGISWLIVSALLTSGNLQTGRLLRLLSGWNLRSSRSGGPASASIWRKNW